MAPVMPEPGGCGVTPPPPHTFLAYHLTLFPLGGQTKIFQLPVSLGTIKQPKKAINGHTFSKALL